MGLFSNGTLKTYDSINVIYEGGEEGDNHQTNIHNGDDVDVEKNNTSSRSSNKLDRSSPSSLTVTSTDDHDDEEEEGEDYFDMGDGDPYLKVEVGGQEEEDEEEAEPYWDPDHELNPRPQYTSSDHKSVLLQYYGSVWPQVLPYCISNAILAGLVIFLKKQCNIDLTFNSQGHTFMSTVLSFLVVTRSGVSYHRMMEARHDLENLYRSSKEIVHYMAIFSGKEQGETAKAWRSEVAYKIILLLRVTMAALEHTSSKANSWDIPEINKEEKRSFKRMLALEGDDAASIPSFASPDAMSGSGMNLRKTFSPSPVASIHRKSPLLGHGHSGGSTFSSGGGDWGFGGGGGGGMMPPPPPQQQRPTHRRSLSFSRRQISTRNRRSKPTSVIRWAHGPRTVRDENFRAPIILCYRLRASIVSHKKLLDERLHVNEEREMLSFVSQYMDAYHGLRKIVFTPYPFPLLQMTRWFLYFWVFTIPFALTADIDETLQIMIIVFFITYGFLGLEAVSMELDDPFGDDPNDFDNLGMAQMVFEDIYITIKNVDGLSYAQELRNKISDRKKQDTPLGHHFRESNFLFEPYPAATQGSVWD